MKEIDKFDVKVNVIPNGLEKYMAFTIIENLIFIDIMQFMNSRLDAWVKTLMMGLMIINIYHKSLGVSF